MFCAQGFSSAAPLTHSPQSFKCTPNQLVHHIVTVAMAIFFIFHVFITCKFKMLNTYDKKHDNLCRFTVPLGCERTNCGYMLDF